MNNGQQSEPGSGVEGSGVAGTDDFDHARKLFEAGHLSGAEATCRQIIALQPNHSHALHMLGIIVGEKGNPHAGLDLLARSIEANPNHPGPHYARGNIFMELEQPAAAIEAYEQALRIDPGHLRARHHLGVAFRFAGRLADAETTLKAVLSMAPDAPDVHNNLGIVQMLNGSLTEAVEHYREAIRLAPDYREPHANLAILYEQSNQLEAAHDTIRGALEKWPDYITLQLVAAKCERRMGRFREARHRLQTQLSSREDSKLAKEVAFESGWCEDGLGNIKSAYKYFSQANELVRSLWGEETIRESAYAKQAMRLLQLFTSKWVAGWQARAQPSLQDEGLSPAFLLGFPRSGTTLVDTILGSHERLLVLEEQPTVQAMVEAAIASPGGYEETLTSLDEARRGELQERYFTVLASVAGEAGGRRIIDKSPFNLAHAGFIYRIFPQAPIIVTLRHPLDVCLSCFMHDFDKNAGTLNFTSLEDTIRLYQQVMTLWLRYRSLLPLHYLELRYEDLVEHPEREIRALLAFLKVPWSETVLDHRPHAMARGRIPTPSYSQVSRPIYKDAKYRWQRYARYLEPYRHELAPFIEAFGYDD